MPTFHLVTLMLNLVFTGTQGQTPCGPTGPDGEQIGRCDAYGECYSDEVLCPAGNADCILADSFCCVVATSRPDECH